MIDALSSIVEKGFAAVAEDISKLATKEETATKGQIVALHAQTLATETELRDAKRHQLVTRVADLEEKVFGTARD